MKEIFEDIIRHRRWRDVLCGSGSTLDYTAMLRESLPKLLAQFNIQSMLDAPCGDYSWMSLVKFPPDFVYKGGDIVASMIEQNRQQHPGVDFRVLDISRDTLPDVDMIFVRDCLIHFSDDDVARTLDNFCQSSVKYVMLTSYLPQFAENQNIQTGNFRGVNMQKPPFNLPEPLAKLEDGPPNHVVKTMDLWSVQQLRESR